MNDLTAGAIGEALARYGASLGQPLHLFACTGSTNDDAREAALAGAPPGTLFVADTQRAGRGRGAHGWHSPGGENLYFSVLLRPRVEPRRMAVLSLVVGVCIARVIERRLMREGRVEDGRVKLKWPNDVLVLGKKVSGVLIEGRLRGEELQHLVVGVGVNVRTREFPLELEGKATSLGRLGCVDLDRADLLGELLWEIGRAAACYARDGLGAFEGELRRLDFLLGKRVRVGTREGTARGMDGEGCVVVEMVDGGLIRVSSGELVVLSSGMDS